ncbi:MAG: YgiT-type zinc finger protein [Firmicutes bacterium]|jgi:YgiT-type zinc finger domain-containing protein|nr:YgiT-type zinc finger protein [Bacillota bacterium]
MERRYCDVCRRETEVVVTERKETYPVKGEPITIDAKVKVCSQCGTDLFDEDLDSINLDVAFEIFRRKHGLLGPDDVRMCPTMSNSIGSMTPTTPACCKPSSGSNTQHSPRLQQSRGSLER